MAEPKGIEKRVDEVERKLTLVIETQRRLIESMRERRLITQNGDLPIEDINGNESQ